MERRLQKNEKCLRESAEIIKRMEAPTPFPNRLLNTKEIAKFMRVSVSTIYVYISQDLIPYHRLYSNSSRIHFERKEIMAWLKRGGLEKLRERLKTVKKQKAVPPSALFEMEETETARQVETKRPLGRWRKDTKSLISEMKEKEKIERLCILADAAAYNEKHSIDTCPHSSWFLDTPLYSGIKESNFHIHVIVYKHDLSSPRSVIPLFMAVESAVRDTLLEPFIRKNYFCDKYSGDDKVYAIQTYQLPRLFRAIDKAFGKYLDGIPNHEFVNIIRPAINSQMKQATWCIEWMDEKGNVQIHQMVAVVPAALCE